MTKLSILCLVTAMAAGAFARAAETEAAGGVIATYSDGKTTGVHPPVWQVLADGDVSEQVLSTGRFATTVTSGLAFSRATLERVMPIPEKVFSQAADGYLVRAAALLGPVQALDATLARYRRHSTNDSTFSPQSDQPAQFFPEGLSLTLVEDAAPEHGGSDHHPAVPQLQEVQSHNRARRDQRQERCLKTCER